MFIDNESKETVRTKLQKIYGELSEWQNVREKLCALGCVGYTSKCAIFNEYAQIAHGAWVSQSRRQKFCQSLILHASVWK